MLTRARGHFEKRPHEMVSLAKTKSPIESEHPTVLACLLNPFVDLFL